MSDGRRGEKRADRQGLRKVLLPALAAVLCIAAAVLAIGSRTDAGGGEAALNPSDTVGTKKADADPEPGEGQAESSAAAEEQREPADTSGTEDMYSESDEGQEESPAAVAEKRGAAYEERLAAGTVVAVSIKYLDFEIEGIWLAGETEPADRADSGGVYVIFTADGTRQAVHAYPLEGERTEVGTVDLYTTDLGYAAFEPVLPESVDTAACRQIEMEDLEDFIAQSLLMTLYEHGGEGI